MTVNVQASRTWFSTAGAICDLDVTNEIRESANRRLDLITVVGEMKEVEQHAHVRVACVAQRSHECGDICCSAERIRFRAADWLNEDGRANLRGGGSSKHQVLNAELVLLDRSKSLDSIAIQRVERRNAELIAEREGHIDVVPELLRSVRQRQHSAVRPYEIAREEVQADELYAGVTNGPDEGVELGIARDRLIRPWPPELDRVEAR